MEITIIDPFNEVKITVPDPGVFDLVPGTGGGSNTGGTPVSFTINGISAVNGNFQLTAASIGAIDAQEIGTTELVNFVNDFDDVYVEQL